MCCQQGKFFFQPTKLDNKEKVGNAAKGLLNDKFIYFYDRKAGSKSPSVHMAYVSTRPTKRQRQSLKQKELRLSEHHYLVEWDGDDSHSVVPLKLIIHDFPESLKCGDRVKVKGTSYSAVVVASGTKSELEEVRKQYDSDDEQSFSPSSSSTSTSGKKQNKGSAKAQSSKERDVDTPSPTPSISNSSNGKQKKKVSPQKAKGKQHPTKRSPKKAQAAKEQEEESSSRKRKSSSSESPAKRKCSSKPVKVVEASEKSSTDLQAKKARKDALNIERQIGKGKQKHLIESSKEMLALAGFCDGDDDTDLVHDQITNSREVTPQAPDSPRSYGMKDDDLYPPVGHQTESNTTVTPTHPIPIRRAFSDPQPTHSVQMEMSDTWHSKYSSPMENSDLRHSHSSSQYTSPLDMYTYGPYTSFRPEPTGPFYRSPTPLSDSSKYSFGQGTNDVMLVLNRLRDDFNRLSSDVETLKIEVRKRRKGSKDKDKVMVTSHSHEDELGCWFGVKGNERQGVFIPGTLTQSDLAAVDTCATAGELSQQLTELLFSKEEMARGCATKPRKEGITQLDTKRLHAIRVHIAHRFKDEGELYSPGESKQWKTIKSEKINVRCRQYRASHGLKC